MIYTEYIKIKSCIVHQVGNKSADDGLMLSDVAISLDENTSKILEKYILGQVTTDGYYQFWHESELGLNELYAYSKRCYEDNEEFVEVSKLIAKHLYSCSTHPKIKNGELCVVLFRNVIVDGVTCEAIGIFKSENKDTFLKMVSKGGRTEIFTETGININKLDKAAIIFNTQAENGYWVTVIDRTNKAMEAKYWTENFLKVRPCNNSYNQTGNLIAMTRSFVSHLPEDGNKSEKALMVQRSMEAVKASSVNMEDYALEVFKDEDVARQFSEYTRKKSEDEGFGFDDEIKISPLAVKKKQTTTLTTVKLDGNFDIRIHGGEQLIEQGYDEEKRMRYYKLYYREER